MIAARVAVQRPPTAKLLAVTGDGQVSHHARSAFPSLLRSGDLLVANDAATLPASLCGRHLSSGRPIEVRLAGRPTLAVHEVSRFSAIVFGAGDFRMRTEDRPPPPALARGDQLELGPLRATVTHPLAHPRLIHLQFDHSPGEVWEGLARHGRPIQYSHLAAPLAIWDTWTPIAGLPVAFEPPSAGFALDWGLVASLAERHFRFATVTHAAGISSTGDAELDRLLPFDEPYCIPASTAREIRHAQARGGRVIAVGTTVVRALEHAASLQGVVPAGDGVATQRIGPGFRLRVVDALLSGTHEPGTSHHTLLRAFAGQDALGSLDRELVAHGYRTHEFGDSVLIERAVGG